MKYKYLLYYCISLLCLFFCGAMYGIYMVKYFDAPTVIAHLYQLVIFGIGAMTFDWVGTWRIKEISNNKYYSQFGKLGLYFVYIISAPIGYILSRHILVRMIFGQ